MPPCLLLDGRRACRAAVRVREYAVWAWVSGWLLCSIARRHAWTSTRACGLGLASDRHSAKVMQKNRVFAHSHKYTSRYRRPTSTCIGSRRVSCRSSTASCLIHPSVQRQRDAELIAKLNRGSSLSKAGDDDDEKGAAAADAARSKEEGERRRGELAKQQMEALRAQAVAAYDALKRRKNAEAKGHEGSGGMGR